MKKISKLKKILVSLITIVMTIFVSFKNIVFADLVVYEPSYVNVIVYSKPFFVALALVVALVIALSVVLLIVIYNSNNKSNTNKDERKLKQ